MTKAEMAAAVKKLQEDLKVTDALIESLEINMSAIAVDYSTIVSRRHSAAETIQLLSSLLEKVPGK